MQLALYQPDIPQNVGSMFRLCACFGVPCHIIEPCGFAFDERRLRAVAMDYMDHVKYLRHASWEAFLKWMGGIEDGRMGRMEEMKMRRMQEHTSTDSFFSSSPVLPIPASAHPSPPRLILLTSKTSTYHHQFAFRPDDILLMGRESAGVPDSVTAQCHASLRISMVAGVRSLNVVQAASIVLAEALRQTAQSPFDTTSLNLDQCC